jgi:hypothetical protein
MKVSRRQAMRLIAAAVPAVAGVRALKALPQAATTAQSAATASQVAALSPVAEGVRRFVFDGISSELRISMKELGEQAPADLSRYSHLVMEMRMSSPQRLYLWAYTAHGPRGVSIIGFGQNAWMRASIPLQYFVGRDSNGNDLASAQNRRTNCCWYSVWGPFGEIHAVESIGIAMEYPLNRPTIELRNVHLSTKDEGSEFLESAPVLDEFGQWALADWPRKLKSKEQLVRELAAEEKSFGSAADFGCGRYGGYASTQARATGFFRVEQIDGRWWFVDPEGHLFLSTGINGTPGGGAGFGGNDSGAAVERAVHRLNSWGMTTGGTGRPSTMMLRWPSSTSYLGMPDVYSPEFAAQIDASAKTQCEPHKDDPMLIGYFVGNEPPWNGRESELCGLILAGADSATKTKLKEFLAEGDTATRRREFVLTSFTKVLEILCGAVRRHDPNHLLLGIRYGGTMSDEAYIAARIFDVCSINVYEYEPTKQIIRAGRLTGRPILIGEFHIGVPADGLAAGLVQAKDQPERGVAYRYYVEQAAGLEWFVGAYWFAWKDEPVLGRKDGENYNIGFVDVTDRPYTELIAAAQETHKRLHDVHTGRVLPFARHPLASDAGAPSSPWPLSNV